MDDATRAGAGWPGPGEIGLEIVELRLRVAAEVRRRREAAGLSQAEFAGRIGVTRAYVARIENGRGVSLDRLFHAYFATNAKVDDLARVD